VGKSDEAFWGYALLEPVIPCSDLIGAMCRSTGEGRDDGEREGGVMGVMERRVEVCTCSDGSREEYRHGCASGGHDAIRISRVQIGSMTKNKTSGEGDYVSLATEEGNIELRFSWEEKSVAEARV
jgi:hypothetical protein